MMPRIVLPLFGLGLAMLQAASAVADALPPGAIRVQPVEVVDRQGFGKPLVAATVMMPAGWKASGGVYWQGGRSGCGPNTPHFAWQAVSSDGRSAIEILPEQTWAGNNFGATAGLPGQSCPNVWFDSARQYLEAWVQQNRSGARIVEVRDRPDFVKLLNQQLAAQPPMAMPGAVSRQWAEGAQAVLRYDRGGIDTKELVGIAVLFNAFEMQGLYPGEIQATRTITTLPGFAMRAPAASFDERMAEMLRKSGRPGREWQARMAQHNAKMNRINTEGARQRSRILAEHGEEMRQMQQESWERQNASRDRMQRETTESIRGTETYLDPVLGDQVELDSSYGQAWRLDDGTYVLTDDASFDPYATTGQSGKQLQVAP